MNTESKYRGFSRRLQKWVFGNFVHPNAIVGDVVECDEYTFLPSFWEQCEPESIGQLMDFDIFEGDLCKTTDGSIIEITFQANAFWGIYLNKKGISYNLGIANGLGCNLEVIGNTYQNPEILGGVK